MLLISSVMVGAFSLCCYEPVMWLYLKYFTLRQLYLIAFLALLLFANADGILWTGKILSTLIQKNQNLNCGGISFVSKRIKIFFLGLSMFFNVISFFPYQVFDKSSKLDFLLELFPQQVFEFLATFIAPFLDCLCSAMELRIIILLTMKKQRHP